MASADRDGFTAQGAAVVLPELQIGGGAGRRTGGRGLQLPAYGADGGAEHAIDEDNLAVRETMRLISRLGTTPTM